MFGPSFEPRLYALSCKYLPASYKVQLSSYATCQNPPLLLNSHTDLEEKPLVVATKNAQLVQLIYRGSLDCHPINQALILCLQLRGMRTFERAKSYGAET